MKKLDVYERTLLPVLPLSYGGSMRSKSKQEVEQSLKLPDVQRRWLDNYLDAKRDFESDRVYESTVTVIKLTESTGR